MLVVLELTVIRTAWTFNVDYGGLILAGVIWMLGWCMVLLAAVIWLPTWVVGLVGLLIVVLGRTSCRRSHRRAVRRCSGCGNSSISVARCSFGENGPTITILYTTRAVDWRHGSRLCLRRDRRHGRARRASASCSDSVSRRRRSSSIAGGVMVFAGPPSDDRDAGAFRSAESAEVSRVAALPADDARPVDCAAATGGAGAQRVADVLDTFGRVPLFYYLLHIPLIHATALARRGTCVTVRLAPSALRQPHTCSSRDPPQQWSLPLLYLVWAIDVAILYVACRWYMDLKATRPRSVDALRLTSAAETRQRSIAERRRSQ